MEQIFCQSCGMPLNEKEHFGTNKDSSQNDDYCIYCFKEGAFTQDMTMDEMIEHCLVLLDEFNKDAPEKMTIDEARANMKEYFPKLKRWAKA